MANSVTKVPIRHELRDTLKLAWPIVLSQVGNMSMGLVDTIVAGRIDTVTLGGLGLAANVFWTFASVCLGSLLALDTYFSQSVGAKDDAALGVYLKQSFWSCGFVTVLSGVMIIASYLVYLALTQPSPTRAAVAGYLEVIIWALPSIFVFFVLQRYWQARGVVMPFTIIIIAANVLNLAACFALGLGHWGFPRMEVRGIALATAISRYAMVAAAVAYSWWRLRPKSLKPDRPDLDTQRRFFTLGVPAAGHTALEVGAFAIATFLVGSLGAAPLAAHHVTLMMAAFTFMFPMGFSAAAAVRVGTFIGSGEPERARLAGWLCIIISVSVMSCFALGYLLIPEVLLNWFTNDPEVIAIGKRILMLVALFQIADGIQVCTTGALRGLGNTKAAMIANLIGHYPVGLALGLILCFGLGKGVIGMWVGLAAGLISVAGMLIIVWVRFTRDIVRLRPLGHIAGPETVPQKT